MISEKQAIAGQGLITNLDLSEYWGRSGATIRIATRGGRRDFGVRVTIKDILGALVEEGLATWKTVRNHPNTQRQHAWQHRNHPATGS